MQYDDGPPVTDTREDAALLQSGGKAPVKLDACEEWLARQLSTQPGERQRCSRPGRACRLCSLTTLYKAAKRLGVVENVVDGRNVGVFRIPSLVPPLSELPRPPDEETMEPRETRDTSET